MTSRIFPRRNQTSSRQARDVVTTLVTLPTKSHNKTRHIASIYRVPLPFLVARAAGLEPTTYGLEGRRRVLPHPAHRSFSSSGCDIYAPVRVCHGPPLSANDSHYDSHGIATVRIGLRLPWAGRGSSAPRIDRNGCNERFAARVCHIPRAWRSYHAQNAIYAITAGYTCSHLSSTNPDEVSK